MADHSTGFFLNYGHSLQMKYECVAPGMKPGLSVSDLQILRFILYISIVLFSFFLAIIAIKSVYIKLRLYSRDNPSTILYLLS